LRGVLELTGPADAAGTQITLTVDRAANHETVQAPPRDHASSSDHERRRVTVG
jgi:hypothetical protein